MISQVQTVQQFKAYAKFLIKDFRFQKACLEVLGIVDREAFQELNLREETTLVHWWTKVFLKAGDLRKLTQKCLTRVNTMVNTITTSSYTKVFIDQ